MTQPGPSPKNMANIRRPVSPASRRTATAGPGPGAPPPQATRQPAPALADRGAVAPYSAVPFPTAKAPMPGELHLHHDLLDPRRRTGYIDVTVTTLTPFFTGVGDDGPIHVSAHIGDGPQCRWIIPDTSVKGLLRSYLRLATGGRLPAVPGTRQSLRQPSYDHHQRGSQQVYEEYVAAGGAPQSRPRRDQDAGYRVQVGKLTWDPDRAHWAIRSFGAERFPKAELQEAFQAIRGTAPYPKGVTVRHSGPPENYAYDDPAAAGLQLTPIWYINTPPRPKSPPGMVTITGSGTNPQPPGSRKGYLYLTGSVAGRTSIYVVPDNPNGSTFNLTDTDEAMRRLLDPDLQSDFEKAAYPSLATLKKNPRAWAPVWFTVKDRKIHYVGRSGGFRIPAHSRTESTLNAIPAGLRATTPSAKNWAPDVVEALLGLIDAPGVGAARARINCSTLATQTGITALAPVTYTLMSPKPSAFLHYLNQPGTANHVNTWLDGEKAGLRGYKVYLHRKQVIPSEKESTVAPDNDGQDKTSVTFAPLPAGTTFRGRINFHNLTDDELHLLIATLQLGNGPGGTISDSHTEPVSAHKLGGARSKGYGSIHIQFTLTTLDVAARYTSSPPRRHAGLTTISAQELTDYTARAADTISNHRNQTWTDLVLAASYRHCLNPSQVRDMALNKDASPTGPYFSDKRVLPPLRDRGWPPPPH